MSVAADTVAVLEAGGVRYAVEDNWARLPPGFNLGDVAAVGVDSKGLVHALAHGDHPVVVFSPDGEVLRTWGHGQFTRPHGLQIGPNDELWITDDGGHAVSRFSVEGTLELQVGTPGKAAAFMSCEPFCRCTHSALAPDGGFYVADGYGNACVHKYDALGRHLKTWGRSGVGPGEFYLPHNIVCDAEGRVYVADRENNRMQVFDPDGGYLTEWRNLHRPCALCMSGQGSERRVYIGELPPGFKALYKAPNLGPRVSILDGDGVVLGRLDAGEYGVGGGRFLAPHGIAVNRRGDIFLGELSNLAWPVYFPDTPRPTELTTLRRLRRL